MSFPKNTLIFAYDERYAVSSLIKLFNLLDSAQRKKLLFLQILVFFMSCLEVLSVIAIGPFMALLGNLDSIQAPGIINTIYEYFGFVSNREFIIFFGASVLSIMLLSACFSLYTIKVLYQFGSSIGGSVSNRLFNIFYFSLGYFIASIVAQV